VPWEGGQGAVGSGDDGPEILTIDSNPASARETQEDVGVGMQVRRNVETTGSERTAIHVVK
jgi:hypothetical protein